MKKSFKVGKVRYSSLSDRAVKGYESLYSVSSNGQITSHGRTWMTGNGLNSLKKTVTQIAKTATTKKGYLIVHFSKDGKSRNKSVHRVVAEAFIPNPENKPQVNHINGVKTDNRAENLEWCTNQENCAHAVKLGIHTSCRQRLLNREQVQKIRQDAVVGVWGWRARLVREFGTSFNSIAKILAGKLYKDYA